MLAVPESAVAAPAAAAAFAIAAAAAAAVAVGSKLSKHGCQINWHACAAFDTDLRVPGSSSCAAFSNNL